MGRAKSAVFKGKKEKTVGGLSKANLTKNKFGKVVSKKASDRGKRSKWAVAVSQARKELKCKGFVPIGGKTAPGKALLAKARSFYKKKKNKLRQIAFWRKHSTAFSQIFAID